MTAALCVPKPQYMQTLEHELQVGGQRNDPALNPLAFMHLRFQTKRQWYFKNAANKSKETKDDPYLIVVSVTTLGQQTSWLILHTTDKKVSNSISFSLAWMYLAYPSATSVHVSTSSMC